MLVAVARVSTLGYLGSFTAPALIGYLTSRSSLPTALLLPPSPSPPPPSQHPSCDRPAAHKRRPVDIALQRKHSACELSRCRSVA